MRARITDAYDLEFRWEECGIRRIVFKPISNSEFEVCVDLYLTEGLNYQTPTRISFSTTCYARSLWGFRDSLSKLTIEDTDSAKYYGSQDMEILVGIESEKPNIGSRTTRICTLIYEPFQLFDMIAFPGQIKIPLGGVEDLGGTIKTMNEFISVLKMQPDDSGNT